MLHPFMCVPHLKYSSIMCVGLLSSALLYLEFKLCCPFTFIATFDFKLSIFLKSVCDVSVIRNNRSWSKMSQIFFQAWISNVPVECIQNIFCGAKHHGSHIRLANHRAVEYQLKSISNLSWTVILVHMFYYAHWVASMEVWLDLVLVNDNCSCLSLFCLIHICNSIEG